MTSEKNDKSEKRGKAEKREMSNPTAKGPAAGSRERPARKGPPKINLDGITLEMMLTQLVQEFGWEALAKTIRVNCLTNDPSIKSSLKFFRTTPWARKKVEDFYLRFRQGQARKQAREEAREKEKAEKLAQDALAEVRRKAAIPTSEAP